MSQSAKCIALGLLLIHAGSIHAQWIPRVTHSRPVCCISDRYCYETHALSPPVSAVTFKGVDYLERAPRLNGAAAAVPTVNARRFSLRQAELKNDHCRLTDVALTINEHGHWSLDCTAEQNPGLAEQTRQVGLNVYSQNRLHIRVRPLIGDSIDGPESLDQVKAPSAAEINVGTVWLQRGEVRRLRFEGYSHSGIERAFAEIHFVAVDLRFE